MCSRFLDSKTKDDKESIFQSEVTQSDPLNLGPPVPVACHGSLGERESAEMQLDKKRVLGRPIISRSVACMQC